MDPLSWGKLHGATTHFPVALMVCALGCDLLGFALWSKPWTNELKLMGQLMLVVAAVGSIGAIVSGIMLTRGVVLGHGEIRRHHLFAWPAFALLVGTACWRTIVRPVSRAQLGACLVAEVATTMLVLGAAYWGGEMLLQS